MHTKEDWLRAICENPADDTLRLVYADWLEEQEETPTSPCPQCNGNKKVPYCSRFMYSCSELGIECDCKSKKICETCKGIGNVQHQSRASLIREQVAEGHITHNCHPNSPQWHPLCLVPELAALPSSWTCTGYNRGFLSEIVLDCDSFVEHAPVLFRQHPITSVRLTDVVVADNMPYGEDSEFYSVHDNSFVGHSTARIPPDLWTELDGFTVEYAESYYMYGIKQYATPELARAALSPACVRYGRKKAGLPPLYTNGHTAHLSNTVPR